MNLLKVRKTAKILCAVSVGVLLMQLGGLVRMFAVRAGGMNGAQFVLASNAVMAVASLVILVNIIALLRDICRAETPFLQSNVRRLRTAAVLLILF